MPLDPYYQPQLGCRFSTRSPGWQKVVPMAADRAIQQIKEENAEYKKQLEELAERLAALENLKQA